MGNWIDHPTCVMPLFLQLGLNAPWAVSLVSIPQLPNIILFGKAFTLLEETSVNIRLLRGDEKVLTRLFTMVASEKFYFQT